MTAVTPKRRWYQFSLMAMLVVMTVLCVGPGRYVAYEQSKARRQKTAVEAMEKFGGTVEYDDSVTVHSPMLRQSLGNESFGNVRYMILNHTRVQGPNQPRLGGAAGA